MLVMPQTPFLAPQLNTYNIGYLERGRVGMGCVLDVIRGVLASIKGGHPEIGWGNSYLICPSYSNAVLGIQQKHFGTLM